MNDDIITIGIFLFMGAVFVLTSIRFILLRNKMLRVGVHTAATVLDVQVGRIIKTKSGPKRKYTYTLEYMAGNTNIITKSSFKTSQQDFVVGEKIGIAYFPDKPKSIMFEYNLTDAPINKIIPVVFLAIGVVLVIIGLVLTFSSSI